MLHVYNEIAASFTARVFLGLLFFFQGYDAVFRVKVKGVIEAFEYPAGLKHLGFLLVPAAYYTSYVELVGGLFLTAGLCRDYALYLLGTDILIASVAFGIVRPMWDMKYVFPRLALLLFLLVIPSEWDVISLDHYLLHIK